MLPERAAESQPIHANAELIMISALKGLAQSQVGLSWKHKLVHISQDHPSEAPVTKCPLVDYLIEAIIQPNAL